MFSNIGVVGAGAMGTAISQTICENTQNESRWCCSKAADGGWRASA